MSRRDDMRDREYRAAYAESFLDTLIATQIKVLREQRGYTQATLAELAGMRQSRISAMENVGYSKWNINTLKRLARAFDVPLFAFFGTFGELVNRLDNFSRPALERPAFENDPAFKEPSQGDTTARSMATPIQTDSLDVPLRMVKANLGLRAEGAASTGNLMMIEA